MSRRNPGFTLVELLVVIAIIGVLVALLLPAVQMAREAARRTQCTNHLKQMGIACQNHHDTYKFFPSAGNYWGYAPEFEPVSNPAADPPGQPLIAPRQRAGWAYQILPFLEQNIVYMGNGASTYEDAQRQIMATPIPTYFCPSRRAPQVLTTNSWYPAGLAPQGTCSYAHMDYAGSNHSNTGVIIQTNANQTWANGGPISTAQVSDGTSNTILIGEKRLNVGRLGSFQSDDNEGYTSGFDHDVMRYTDRSPRLDHTNNDPAGGDGGQRFGSSHPGGFMAVFADASVRVISYDIELTNFNRLGMRNDGEPVTVP
jgi:prepilin-type N-terminal cleavage/methylation domain-containing protein